MAAYGLGQPLKADRSCKAYFTRLSDWSKVKQALQEIALNGCTVTSAGGAA
jgi:hypothetical protein